MVPPTGFERALGSGCGASSGLEQESGSTGTRPVAADVPADLSDSRDTGSGA
jgi:hypothetical protein